MPCSGYVYRLGHNVDHQLMFPVLQTLVWMYCGAASYSCSTPSPLECGCGNGGSVPYGVVPQVLSSRLRSHAALQGQVIREGQTVYPSNKNIDFRGGYSRIWGGAYFSLQLTSQTRENGGGEMGMFLMVTPPYPPLNNDPCVSPSIVFQLLSMLVYVLNLIKGEFWMFTYMYSNCLI